jgi:signal transduction histidine kinase
MKQILLNLLSNAIKFTNAGGQIVVGSRRKASGAVRVRVQDNGVGMSEAEIEQAKQPFRQLDTAPRKQVGTGLGLPLTRALVKANRAKFKLASAARSGTRVTVTFPAERTVDKS